jgi:predicted AAA+ superfamily ATPase
MKSFLNHGEEPPFWYYRTKEKEEVDILIEKDGKLYPIEIKLSSRITPEDMKGIKSLEKAKVPLGKAAFITASPRPYPLAKNAVVVPYTIIQNF